MTKEQEIKALEVFIESLPKESYLHDFFAEEFPTIRETILNDGWYEVTRSMAQLRQERKNLEASIKELTIEEKTRQERVEKLRRDQKHGEQLLKELGEKAGKIWSMLR
jgi:translation initiation factor 2 beta subunit (eIF-2beta)/eIF-5